MSEDKKDARQRRLLQLQTSSVNSWRDLEEKPDPKTLDANLKKNTGFIKKCKTNIGSEGISALLKDVETLQLKKYLSEIVSAITEGVSRCSSASDFSAAIDLISVLHKRFSKDFTVDFVSGISKIISMSSKIPQSTLNSDQKEKDEISRLAKLKVYFRILAEMYVSGLLWGIDSTEEYSDRFDKNFILSGGNNTHTKTDMTKYKEISKSSLYCILYAQLFGLLAIYFSKIFKRDFNLGVLDPETDIADCVFKIDEIEVITHSQIDGIKNLLYDFLNSGFSQLKKMISMLKKLETKNKEQLYTKGSISEELKIRYDKWLNQVEKLKSLLQMYSECLGKDMIEIKEENDSSEIGINFDSVSLAVKDEPSTNWWVDEEEKLFYTHIFDLRSKVPPVFLDPNSRKSNGSKNPSIDDKKIPIENKLEQDDTIELDAIDYEDFVKKRAEHVLNPSKIDVPPDDDNTEKTTGLKDRLDSESNSSRLDTLLSILPTLANRERTDDAAVEYCLSSTKTGHKKIIRVLLDIPRKRQDLIPFYSRFIATVDPFMPSIGSGVVDGLESEFRWLVRNKIKDLLEVRLRNARYISELTKFRICPPYKTVRCCKILVNNFSSQDIEVLCTFLEGCGRFLLSNTDSKPHMLQLLEIVLKKKASLNIDQRLVVLIDSAYLQCFPSTVNQADKKSKKKTILEEYIQNLIYEKLSKDTAENIFRLIRKLPWNDKYPYDTCDDLDSQSVHKTLINCFTKSHKVKNSLLPVLAMLVGMISKYHPWFRVRIVDNVLENIRLGLESNLFINNQRRISDIKYLAELYDFRIIDSNEVFETLYLLINFGYTNNNEDGTHVIPYPGRSCYVDSPFDYFRIKLVCTLLDKCGVCFDSAPSKTYLQIFLAFFELYILSKSLPIPLDMKNSVDDTFLKLRPGSPCHDSWNEAVISLEKVVQINRHFIKSKILERSVPTEDIITLNHALDKSSVLPNANESSSDFPEILSKDETLVIEPSLHEIENPPSSDHIDILDSTMELTDDTSDYIDGVEDLGKGVLDENDASNLNEEGSDQVVVLRNHDKIDDSWQKIKEAKEFDDELQKMFLESLNTRKLDRTVPLDMAIPLQLRDRKSTNILPNFNSKETQGSYNPNEQFKDNLVDPGAGYDEKKLDSDSKGVIKFSLLTGKKQKPTIKNLLVPETSSLALKTRAHQIEAQQEKERLNQIVLNYETQAVSVPSVSLPQRFQIRKQK
ncbi:Regulator of nonsense transcripts 2 [Smittium mucronatum]|uniref:Regulator of nonsense transcripts 2 n=1 Tax=Smittium mucronatum TaxID=133383 RepID=A0A1R0H8Z5_9FUNG|nr:Regulator of nonsense transcripts 2 [Smittium mucronatum]